MPNLIEKIVKERGENYGRPADNHRRTALLWGAYLDAKFLNADLSQYHGSLNSADVCFLNILQKIARCQNRITRDSLQDIAGYALNAVEITETPHNDLPQHPGV